MGKFHPKKIFVSNENGKINYFHFIKQFYITFAIMIAVCEIRFCAVEDKVLTSKEIFIIRHVEGNRIIPLKVQLDAKEQMEEIKILDSQNTWTPISLRDILRNKIAYKDLKSKQCFVANHLKGWLQNDRRKLQEMKNGLVREFHIPTLYILKELKNETEIHLLFGEKITTFCRNMSVSYVTKDEHLQISRRKRQATGNQDIDRGQFIHRSYGHYGHQSNNYAQYGHDTQVTGTIDKNGIIQNPAISQYQERSQVSQSYPFPKIDNENSMNTRQVLSSQGPFQSSSYSPRTPINTNNQLSDKSNPDIFSSQSRQESGYQHSLPFGLTSVNRYHSNLNTNEQLTDKTFYPAQYQGFNQYGSSLINNEQHPGINELSKTIPRRSFDGLTKQPDIQNKLSSTQNRQSVYPGSFQISDALTGVQPHKQGLSNIQTLAGNKSHPGSKGQIPQRNLIHDSGNTISTGSVQSETRNNFLNPDRNNLMHQSRFNSASNEQGFHSDIPDQFKVTDRQMQSSTNLDQLGPLTDRQLRPSVNFHQPRSYSREQYPLSPQVNPFIRHVPSEQQGLTSVGAQAMHGLGQVTNTFSQSTRLNYQSMNPSLPQHPSLIKSQNPIYNQNAEGRLHNIRPHQLEHPVIYGADHGGNFRKDIPNLDANVDRAGQEIAGGPHQTGYIGNQRRTINQSIPTQTIQKLNGTHQRDGNEAGLSESTQKIPSRIPSYQNFFQSQGTKPGHVRTPDGSSNLNDLRNFRTVVDTDIKKSIIGHGDSASSQTQIQSRSEGTAAEAFSSGSYKGLGSQTQVHGKYDGNGSFSAQAQSGFIRGVTQSQVQGGKHGGLSGSSAIVENVGSAQSQVQIGKPSGSASSIAQGRFSQGMTQVKAQSSRNGGSAGAESQSRGLSNSQVQVDISGGETKNDEDFLGSISASVQGGVSSGQSQTQLQGNYNSGRTYIATAQGGFNALDHFHETGPLPGASGISQVTGTSSQNPSLSTHPINSNIFTDIPQHGSSLNTYPDITSGTPVETYVSRPSYHDNMGIRLPSDGHTRNIPVEKPPSFYPSTTIRSHDSLSLPFPSTQQTGNQGSQILSSQYTPNSLPSSTSTGNFQASFNSIPVAAQISNQRQFETVPGESLPKEYIGNQLPSRQTSLDSLPTYTNNSYFNSLINPDSIQESTFSPKIKGKDYTGNRFLPNFQETQFQPRQQELFSPLSHTPSQISPGDLRYVSYPNIDVPASTESSLSETHSQYLPSSGRVQPESQSRIYQRPSLVLSHSTSIPDTPPQVHSIARNDLIVDASVLGQLSPVQKPGVAEPDYTNKTACCAALRNLKQRCCDRASDKVKQSCCTSAAKDFITDFDSDDFLDENSNNGPCKVVKAICYIVYKPVGKARICKPTNSNAC